MNPLSWRPLWLAGGWSVAAAIAWLSLTPTPPRVDIQQGDKLGHLLGYGTLMFWFCQLYVARRVRAAYAGGFAAMGVGIEFLQGALGYRTFEVLDMLANALGVCAGWTLALASGPQVFARIEAALAPRR